jgi:hypothetical protein
MVDGSPYLLVTIQGPPHIKLGEQVGLMVGLTNNLNLNDEVVISLRRSNDYEFIVVSNFEFVRAHDPVTVRGKNLEVLVVLGPVSSKLIHIPVVPLRLGQVTISIDVTSTMISSSESWRTEVVPRGLDMTDHSPLVINLMQKAKQIEHLLINVPESFDNSVERDRAFVPGSRKISLSLVGDAFGISLLNGPLDSDNSVELPQFSGDSILFSIAANILSLHYLKSTNQLTKHVKQQILSGDVERYHAAVSPMMQQLLQLQDTSSGGFRPFRGDTPVSLWFSASVLYYLKAAALPEWEDFFFVDHNLLESITRFLLRHQIRNKTDPGYGSFFEPHNFIWDFRFAPSKEGLTLALTAWALRALSRKVYLLRDGDRMGVDEALIRGRRFLEVHVEDLEEKQNAFVAAMVVKVLQELESHCLCKVWRILEEMKKENEDGVYWSKDDEDIEPIGRQRIANDPIR